MKKLTKLAALFAAGSLIFGGLFLSCDDGDSGNNDPVLSKVIAGGTAEVVKGEKFAAEKLVYAYYDNATVGTFSDPGTSAKDVTAKATFKTDSTEFKVGDVVSLDAGTYTLTVTFGGKTAEGTVVLTVTASDNGGSDDQVYSLTLDSTEITITANADSTFTGTVAAGESTITIMEGTYTVSGTTITATVTKELNDAGTALETLSEPYTMTLSIGDNNVLTLVDEEEEEALNYSFDFSTLGSYSSDTKVTYTTETYFDTAVFLYSANQGLRIRGNTNYINYNGTDADWTSAELNSSLSAPDRYCGFDASKTSATDNVTVTFTYDVKNSSKATGDTAAIAVVDGAGKVLAAATGLKVTSGETGKTISATIAKDGKAVLYFSRGGAGAGGIDVTGITAVSAE